MHFGQWPTALFYKAMECNGVALSSLLILICCNFVDRLLEAGWLSALAAKLCSVEVFLSPRG